MANWYGQARSNYFKVKDIEAFKEALSPVEIEVSYSPENDNCMIMSTDEYGGWPSQYYDEDKDDSVDFELTTIVAQHLVEGQVCVLIETGAEKLRYLSGHSVAFDHSGETVYVSLDDIYAKAEEKFGITPTHASY
jgi:hypothetical protein